MLEVILAKGKVMLNDIVEFVWLNPHYIVCSIVYYIIASVLLGGVFASYMVALLAYTITIFITFTPIGEKLLRFLEHVRKIETRQEKEYLLPLFDEVYAKAKWKNPELGPVQICVIDRMIVNACALGKRTVAVTKGAMETFSEDELKAIMAHEIAHIIYGDTLARLYITVGNGIITLFVLAIMAIIFIAEWIEKLHTKSHTSFSFAWVMIALTKVLFGLMLTAIQFLMKIVMSTTSRKSEFRADRYAYKLGYGEKMVEALYILEKIQLKDSTVIQKMIASHPRITARIEKLENLIEGEDDMQTFSWDS